MDSDKEFEEVLEQSRKRAGIDTLLELQSRYQELVRKHDLIYRSNRKRVITTNSTSYL